MLKSLESHKGFPHDLFIYASEKVMVVVCGMCVSQRDREERGFFSVFLRIESIG